MPITIEQLCELLAKKKQNLFSMVPTFLGLAADCDVSSLNGLRASRLVADLVEAILDDDFDQIDATRQGLVALAA